MRAYLALLFAEMHGQKPVKRDLLRRLEAGIAVQVFAVTTVTLLWPT